MSSGHLLPGKNILDGLKHYIETHGLHSAMIDFCRVFRFPISSVMNHNLKACATAKNRPSKDTFWPAFGLRTSVGGCIREILSYARRRMGEKRRPTERVRLVKEITRLLLVSLRDFEMQSKEAYKEACGHYPPMIILVNSPPTPAPALPEGQVA